MNFLSPKRFRDLIRPADTFPFVLTLDKEVKQDIILLYFLLKAL